MTRFLNVLAIGTVLFGVGAATFPTWISLQFSDISLLWDDSSVKSSSETNVDLSQTNEFTRIRLLWRQNALEKVAYGTVTVEQGIEEFILINHSDAAFFENLKRVYKTDDDRKIAIRQMIGHFNGHALEQHAQSALEQLRALQAK